MILGLPIKYRDAQNQPYRDGYLIDTSVKNVGPNGLNLVAYACTIDKETGILGLTPIANDNIIVDTGTPNTTNSKEEIEEGVTKSALGAASIDS